MTKPLTGRELEVCELIVHGKKNKEIGIYLGMSPRTVEDHRTTIFKKMDVQNAVELTRKFYGISDKLD
jgi:DNA-binding NarL/FixJ family response regulator